MSLEVVCGPMFSGKSSYIYSIVKRYASIGVNVLVVKPSIDTRYSAVPEVVTHDGVRFECVTVASQLMTLPFSVTDGRGAGWRFESEPVRTDSCVHSVGGQGDEADGPVFRVHGWYACSVHVSNGESWGAGSGGRG